MKLKKFILKYSAEIIAGSIATISSIFLMFSTFTSMDNKLFVGAKLWSDFASHIPLIRSFSLGFNFPPEYPLFPGEPIKYHFLFYSLVGFLEKLGLRIDIALNLLSALGFAGLILVIYFLAKEIFKSRVIGILSIIFFLFNSSLSFIYFLKTHPLSPNFLSELITNAEFQSFAPYGTGLITAFWNLNIYTNQRHLALAFALSLGLIFLLVRTINKKIDLNLKLSILLGVLLGLSFYFHLAVLLMTAAVLFCFMIFFSQVRKQSFIILAIAAALSIPQYLYLNSTPGYQMHMQIGYLVSNLTIKTFLEFWSFNLGLSLLLIPLGFVMANKNQRKILLSFFTLFLVGNLIQFSPEIAANHKFFNYFLLVGNMFSAFFLFKLWQNKNFIFKPTVLILTFFMILGGIVDFFPIANDRKIAIEDYNEDKRADWILKNTPANSTFLNTTLLYDPASLAGRKIFLGWPYFAWSQGYDTNQRYEILKQMLGASDNQTTCSLLTKNKIDFVEIQIQNPPDRNIPQISDIFLRNFESDYRLDNYSIYSVEANCSEI